MTAPTIPDTYAHSLAILIDQMVYAVHHGDPNELWKWLGAVDQLQGSDVDNYIAMIVMMLAMVNPQTTVEQRIEWFRNWEGAAR